MLTRVARSSLAHGVRTGKPLPVDPEDYPPALREQRACFVTLRMGEALRGCIGTIEPRAELVVAVAVNAFKAGFHDPRFAPLREEDLPRLAVEISVLSPLEPVHAESEEALVALLRPGVDGVALRAGERFGTFLPAVWRELPEPHEFLRQLKRKAGLPADYWSDTLVVWRYTAEATS